MAVPVRITNWQTGRNRPLNTSGGLSCHFVSLHPRHRAGLDMHQKCSHHCALKCRISPTENMQSRLYNKHQLATAQGRNTSAFLRFVMVRNYTMSYIFDTAIIWRANTASRSISRNKNKKHTQYILHKQGTL